MGRSGVGIEHRRRDGHRSCRRHLFRRPDPGGHEPCTGAGPQKAGCQLRPQFRRILPQPFSPLRGSLRLPSRFVNACCSALQPRPHGLAAGPGFLRSAPSQCSRLAPADSADPARVFGPGHVQLSSTRLPSQHSSAWTSGQTTDTAPGGESRGCGRAF